MAPEPDIPEPDIPEPDISPDVPVASGLPTDPDAERPLHFRPGALAWVFAGGIVGTGLRYVLEEAFAPTGPTAWPWATFGINLAGAFVLGGLLEGLALFGDDSGWRRRMRLFAGTGLCGAFTTYSTFALETSLLSHHGATPTAVAYAVTSVMLGIIGAWLGIGAAAALRRVRPGEVE